MIQDNLHEEHPTCFQDQRKGPAFKVQLISPVQSHEGETYSFSGCVHFGFVCNYKRPWRGFPLISGETETHITQCVKKKKIETCQKPEIYFQKERDLRA